MVHLRLGDHQVFLVAALLVLLDEVAQLGVDGLDHLEAAILLQGASQDGLERLALLGGSHGRLGAEDRFDELLVVVGNAPGIKQCAIEIGCPIVKGGEQEAHLRRGHHPIGLTVVELPFPHLEAQIGLGELHRAHAHQKIAVDLVGAIQVVEAVPGAAGHIVGVAGH